ncbi:hypothetical protein [Dyella silvatica]|uniref:hypothetical protein n=1 Tax=Dyella silvatica TaxID=2992128 RepID=UPI00225AAB95|nr:hypothetical protein [Dyella silvatica]
MNSPSPASLPPTDRSSIGVGILMAVGLSVVLLLIDHELVRSAMTGEVSVIHQAGWMLALLMATSLATAFALGKYQCRRARRGFIITMSVLWPLIILFAAGGAWMMMVASVSGG